MDGDSTPMPNLILTYNGNPFTPGSTAWIWNDPGAQGTPRMPPVIASLSPNNFSQQVRWWAKFSHTGGDGVTRFVETPLTMNPNVHGYKMTSANGTYNLATDTGGVVGGLATLYWKIGNGPEQQTPFRVHGTNPDRAYVKTNLGAVPWFLQKLVTHESTGPCIGEGMRQFFTSCATAGTPVWGAPHGIGLMMLDPPPSYFTLWDWTVNINDGKQVLEQKRQQAVTAWEQTRSAYEIFKATHPAAKPPCDIVEGSAQQCRFGFEATASAHAYLDAVWMKRYNGNSGGGDYLQFVGTGNNKYWKAFRYNSGSRNYVNLVCSADVPNTP